METEKKNDGKWINKRTDKRNVNNQRQLMELGGKQGNRQSKHTVKGTAIYQRGERQNQWQQTTATGKINGDKQRRPVKSTNDGDRQNQRRQKQCQTNSNSNDKENRNADE